MRIAKAYAWKCPGCEMPVEPQKKHLCVWTMQHLQEQGYPKTLSFVLWYRKGVAPQTLWTLPQAGPGNPHHQGFHTNHGEPKCPAWNHHHCDPECPAYEVTEADYQAYDKAAGQMMAEASDQEQPQGGYIAPAWAPMTKSWAQANVPKGTPIYFMPEDGGHAVTLSAGDTFTVPGPTFTTSTWPDTDDIDKAATQAIGESLDAQELVTEAMVAKAFTEWKASIQNLSYSIWQNGNADLDAPIFEMPLYKKWTGLQQQYCEQTGNPPIYHNPYPTPKAEEWVPKTAVQKMVKEQTDEAMAEQETMQPGKAMAEAFGAWKKAQPQEYFMWKQHQASPTSPEWEHYKQVQAQFNKAGHDAQEYAKFTAPSYPATIEGVAAAKQAWVEAGKPSHGPELKAWSAAKKAYADAWTAEQAKAQQGEQELADWEKQLLDGPAKAPSHAEVKALYAAWKADEHNNAKHQAWVKAQEAWQKDLQAKVDGYQALAEQQAEDNLVPLKVDNCGCAEVKAKEQLLAELAQKKSSVTNIEAHESLAEQLRSIASSHGVEMSNFAALEMARAVEDEHQGEVQDQENAEFWHKKYIKAKVEKQHAQDQLHAVANDASTLSQELAEVKANTTIPWDDSLHVPPSTPALSHQVKMGPAGIVVTAPTYQVLKVKRIVDAMTLQSGDADYFITEAKDGAIKEVFALAMANKVGIVSHPTITTWQELDPYVLHIEVTALCVPWAYDEQVKGLMEPQAKSKVE